MFIRGAPYRARTCGLGLKRPCVGAIHVIVIDIFDQSSYVIRNISGAKKVL